jgi:hypothetical protein
MKNAVFLDVALVRTFVAEERIASIIRMTNNSVLHSSETSVLIRATWRNIPEDGIPYKYFVCGGALPKIAGR